MSHLNRVVLLAFGLAACGRSSLLGDFGTTHSDGFTHDGFTGDGGTGDGGAGDGGTGDGGNRDGFSGDGFTGDGGTVDGFGCPTPVNCKNPFCAGNPSCHQVGQEICNNGIDDNDNGLIDCADPECFNSPFCIGLDGGATDGPPPDGFIVSDGGVLQCDPNHPDCADPRCDTNPKCIVLVCQPDVDYGVIAASGATVTRNFDTTKSTRTFNTCAFPGGTAQVGVFQLTQTASIKVDFAQAAGGAHVVDLFRAGALQACDANPIFNGCIAVGQAPTATRSFPNLAPGLYYVIVQSYPNTQGTSTVTISTGCPGTTENCSNGVDDNCNGLVDCADPACFAAANCIQSECTPDINLGALVVGAPPDNLTLDTTSMVANRYHPTCAGTSTGDDVVVRFTLLETAGILVTWSQTGDHVFGLFSEAASGLACDALQTNCFATLGTSNGSVAFAPKAPGQYVFIFKPSSAAEAGQLQLAISAFKNRHAEICDNGIDDDGNGLIDCADPACLGVPPCNAPLCLVDQNLGAFSWGTSVTTTVDTTTGTTLYPVSCASGTGKEKVLRFTVTQPMYLGFSCTDTGSNVFQLAAQLQPLDPCNKHDVNCADPSILPFGCNFQMPNVQPGTYDLIVAAFQSGDEGTVDLTLTGIMSTNITCNTQVQCMDVRCATAPACLQFACAPDNRLGILPLDGTSTSAIVQTSMGLAGADNVTCTTATTGEYQDVDFQLPAKADVTIKWAQVGNADFALFTDSNDLLACDAGTQVSCTASGGVSSGTITLPGLALGRYHLIIKADQAGDEGGVVLQISGAPSP